MFRGTSDLARVDLVESEFATDYGDAAKLTQASTTSDSLAQRLDCENRPLLEDHTQQKQMILMRGLPSCGKTTTARELTGQCGLHIEFDEYFYTQVGKDEAQYDWSAKLLPDARRWNYDRIKEALISSTTPIVIDSDNSPDATTKAYIKLALYHNYQINFAEPDSPWWREIKSLLDDKKLNRKSLKKWAQKLALLNRGTHRVPLDTFLRRMDRWENLSIDTILSAAHA